MLPIDISTQDLFVVGALVFLEGILSIDNALVLALLARDLPEKLQKKALTYGMVGAVVFRALALALVTQLIHLNWIKFVGGGYLIFLAGKHFLVGEKSQDGPTDAKSGSFLTGKKPLSDRARFWRTVVVIELTDIAFALDSILAAVALTSKFWVVFTGGILGIAMMRFAASIFIRLLGKFPEMETTAYLLVLLVGLKVVLEGFQIPGLDFHSASEPAFWIFWGLMAACVAYGLVARKGS